MNTPSVIVRPFTYADLKDVIKMDEESGNYVAQCTVGKTIVHFLCVYNTQKKPFWRTA